MAFNQTADAGLEANGPGSVIRVYPANYSASFASGIGFSNFMLAVHGGGIILPRPPVGSGPGMRWYGSFAGQAGYAAPGSFIDTQGGLGAVPSTTAGLVASAPGWIG